MAPRKLPSGSRLAIRPRGTESDKLLAFLADLATELAAVLALPNLLQHITRVVQMAIGFESCAVSLLELHAGEKTLVVKAGSGLRAGVVGLRFQRGQGLVWEIVEKQMPIIIPDLHADPRVIRKDPGVRSGMYAPITSRNGSIGVLSAYRADVNAFTEPDLHLLTIVARYIASALEVSQLHDALKSAAATDALTGIANRRTCIERLQHEVARCERTHHPLSVVLLDLDDFKTVNDTYGHSVGDAFLVATAQLLVRDVRAIDFVARYGGDEFVLLLPESDHEKATTVLARFYGVKIPIPGHCDVNIDLRLSSGIATWPADGVTVDQLLQIADLRLYRMKEEHGRLAQKRV